MNNFLVRVKLLSKKRQAALFSLLFLAVALPVSLLALSGPTGFFNRAAGTPPPPITPPNTPTATPVACNIVRSITMDGSCGNDGFTNYEAVCYDGYRVGADGYDCYGVSVQMERAKTACYAHGSCNSPSPSPTNIPTPTPKNRVFVTSTTYSGNLGGLVGADAKCQERANAANLGGVWKAWLSDGSLSPSVRFIPSNYPYVRLDGARIADNWTDLVDGSLNTYINITEFGTPYNSEVWSNTKTDGTAKYTTANATCSNWTSSSNYSWAIRGVSWHSDVTWTDGGDSLSLACNSSQRFYCFEQPVSPTPTATPVPTVMPTPTATPRSTMTSTPVSTRIPTPVASINPKSSITPLPQPTKKPWYLFWL